MAPTSVQIKLIRDFEPILFFHGGDANVGAERFFPCDARRYVEHCALWKARDPFVSMADWQSPSPAPPREPAIKAGGIAVTAGGTGVFLGKKTNGGYEFLETSTAEECFLELGGWEPADGYADLDRVADLYQTDLELNASHFWYHAEFFDAVRLRLLFDFVHDQGGPDLMQLFAAHLGETAVLIDPALICYYLFFRATRKGWQAAMALPKPGTMRTSPANGPASRCCWTGISQVVPTRRNRSD